jgi:hypothetical protein
MSKSDKTDKAGVPEKIKGKGVGASVLVAAASLLGTSMAYSAPTSAETVTPAAPDSAGQNAVENPPGEQKVLLAGTLKVNTTTPKVQVNTGVHMVTTTKNKVTGTIAKNSWYSTVKQSATTVKQKE